MKNENATSEKCATLVDLLRLRAATEPDRLAYTFLVDGESEAVTATYASLDRQARAIGAWLQSVGASGERALLLYPPGMEYVAAFFGCLYAGVTAVPAFPPRLNRPMPRLQAIVADGRVKVALTSTAIQENIERRFTHAPEMKSLQWLNTEHVPAGLESTWQEPAITADSLAFLQYTSGSTSLPKGVMLSHGNLLHNLKLITKSFECDRNCPSTFWLPPYHDMGLIGGILEPLYAAAPSVLMAPVAFLQSPVRWLNAISRTKAVISGAPNFAYDLCVNKITAEQKSRLDLSSWKLAFNGAEPIRKESIDRFTAAFEPCGFRKEVFYPCYGLAEATLFVTGGFRSEEPVTLTVDSDSLRKNEVKVLSATAGGARTLVGSGQSPADQRVLIVDPESRILCPAGTVGEIWVQGNSVSRGYWNRPEESAQVFGARLADSNDGPFLRTGDLGFLNEGELFVTGRAKDLIILNGKNHYPQDIELTVEESCPAVRPSCSAAFAVEVEGAERLIIVAEVEKDSRKLNLDDAMAGIRQAVAAHHDVPIWTIVLIKTLTIPKTSSGKIQRRACREKFLNDAFEVIAQWNAAAVREESLSTIVEHSSADDDNPLVDAQTPEQRQQARDIEAWLIAQISERLNMPVENVDVREPFARFGMDSMTAVMLAGDLEIWLGRRLPPTLMYDHPSIEELARHLAEQQPEFVAEVSDHIDKRQAQTLLAGLDQMSADETNALLDKMLAEEAFRTGQMQAA